MFSQGRAQQSQEPLASQAEASAKPSANARGKQPEVNPEDPPEVDPSTICPERQKMPFRGRGRFANAFDNDDKNDDKTNDKDGENEDHRRKRGCHGRRHERGPWGRRAGPPPFMFGPRFPFGPHSGPFEQPAGLEHHEHGHHGGWHGRGGPHRGRFGNHHGPPHSLPRAAPWEQSNEGGFDLSAFLGNLGDRLGIDLTSAAQGLGLKTPRATETDFEPRTDIFDTPTNYTIHLSLPGAKKSDVGVDWDGEHSVLRVAGVVHRPGVDEELMSRLVVDGRKREIGVFEKVIRLGTSKAPASLDVDGITARMIDGVLVIHVPKVEKRFEKKEVHVDGTSPQSNAENPEDAYMNEKDLLFDAEDNDEEMYEAASEHPEMEHVSPRPHEPEATNEKEQEAQRARSETVDFEHKNTTKENLPQYEVEEPEESKIAKSTSHIADEEEDDWEKYGSEDEGEYVKINVD
jgi:HSP20 family protein